MLISLFGLICAWCCTTATMKIQTKPKPVVSFTFAPRQTPPTHFFSFVHLCHYCEHRSCHGVAVLCLVPTYGPNNQTTNNQTKARNQSNKRHKSSCQSPLAPRQTPLTCFFSFVLLCHYCEDGSCHGVTFETFYSSR